MKTLSKTTEDVTQEHFHNVLSNKDNGIGSLISAIKAMEQHLPILILVEYLEFYTISIMETPVLFLAKGYSENGVYGYFCREKVDGTVERSLYESLIPLEHLQGAKFYTPPTPEELKLMKSKDEIKKIITECDPTTEIYLNEAVEKIVSLLRS